MAESDLLEILRNITTPTVDMGGAPREDDSRALADLMLQGGSASVGGQRLFGNRQVPDPVVEAATRAEMGGFGRMPDPSLAQAVRGGQVDPAQVLDRPVVPGRGEAPITAAPTARPKPSLSPNLQRVLDTADEIATSLTGRGEPVTSALLPNPYGAGSFDPNDRAAVARVNSQRETKQALDLLNSFGNANPLAQQFKAAVLQKQLEKSGLVQSAAQKEFDTAKARAAGKAAGEGGGGKLDELLSVEDATKLGVPYGTTKRQAAADGAMPLTKTQQSTISEMGKARGILNVLVPLSQKLSAKYASDPGAANRLLKGIGNKVEIADQNDPELAQYMRLRNGLLASISRTVGGERGQSTEKDVERASKVFPSFDSWLPDTKGLVDSLPQALDEVISDIENNALQGISREARQAELNRRRTGSKEGEAAPAGVPKGAQPTGRTYQGKPVYRAPDGSLHVKD